MATYCRLLFLLLAPVVCLGQKKLADIEYLGLGYDIIYGNPHADLLDAGFREAVFQLEYNTQSVSSDGKWIVPDNVEALQTFGCGYETQTSVIHGTKSYVDSLSRDVSRHSQFDKNALIKFTVVPHQS